MIDESDEAFGNYELVAGRADRRAASRISAAARGTELGPDDGPSEMELDYLRFSDLLGGSIYGGGLSRDELIADYEQLATRWTHR